MKLARLSTLGISVFWVNAGTPWTQLRLARLRGETVEDERSQPSNSFFVRFFHVLKSGRGGGLVNFLAARLLTHA